MHNRLDFSQPTERLDQSSMQTQKKSANVYVQSITILSLVFTSDASIITSNTRKRIYLLLISVYCSNKRL